MNAETQPVDTRVLDLYKLAVEMADRVSARRGTANAFFVSVQSAVVAALGFLASRQPVPQTRYLVAICVVGVLASLIWFLLLRAYRDLNSAKFKVINSLEEQLPVALFNDEWEHLKKDPVSRWRRRYAELGTVERYAPLLFGGLNVIMVITLVKS